MQIPIRWGQGKQFYCRLVMSQSSGLTGSRWHTEPRGPSRKSPARMCTGAGRQPATAGCFGTLRASPPCPDISRPHRPELGVGGSGGGAPGARAQRGGRVRGGGPRSGAARWGPGSCGAERSRRRDRHSPSGHELGTRAPATPDTLQHRRHPGPAHGRPRAFCVSASRVEPWSPVASVCAGGAD